MPTQDPSQRRLQRLRQWRNAPTEANPMQFLTRYFQNTIEKPYKQLGRVADAWMRLVPSELGRHTRLESLKGGVLRVGVSSNARLYELDRLLRDGLERQIISACGKPGVRKVQLRAVSDMTGEHPEPPAEQP